MGCAGTLLLRQKIVNVRIILRACLMATNRPLDQDYPHYYPHALYIPQGDWKVYSCLI